MDTLRIDEWLRTVCTREASDLHLAVGSQPVMHLHGQRHPMATKVLDPADTVNLMKGITPERCQQELREVSRTDFGFAFGERERFRVTVSEQLGNINLVLQRFSLRSSPRIFATTGPARAVTYGIASRTLHGLTRHNQRPSRKASRSSSGR